MLLLWLLEYFDLIQKKKLMFYYKYNIETQ